MANIKKIKYKVFDESLPEVLYKTKGAVAFDLYLRKTITINPREVKLANLNLALELPKEHVAILAARSSLHKFGLMAANGIGIIDEDYCGDSDEYMLPLYNFTTRKVVLKKGERIAQVLILKFVKASLTKVSVLGNPSRGGFGTTGKR